MAYKVYKLGISWQCKTLWHVPSRVALCPNTWTNRGSRPTKSNEHALIPCKSSWILLALKRRLRKGRHLTYPLTCDTIVQTRVLHQSGSGREYIILSLRHLRKGGHLTHWIRACELCQRHIDTVEFYFHNNNTLISFSSYWTDTRMLVNLRINFCF
jgi:hypothetical protein